MQVLQNYGIENINSEIITRHIGLPLDSILDHLEIPYSIKPKIISDFRQNLIFEIEKGTSVYDGVVDFLNELVSCDYALAIATSKPTNLAKLTIQFSVLQQYNIYVQGTDGFPPKPHPEVIHRVLRNHDTGIKSYMVGDRTEDMAAACLSGVIPLGVAQGSHIIEQLVAAGAKLAVSDFSQLHQHISSIRNLTS